MTPKAEIDSNRSKLSQESHVILKKHLDIVYASIEPCAKDMALFADAAQSFIPKDYDIKKQSQ